MKTLPYSEHAPEAAQTIVQDLDLVPKYSEEVGRALDALFEETRGKAAELLKLRKNDRAHTYIGENKYHHDWEIQTTEDWFKLARENGENVVITVEEFSWKDNMSKCHFLITCISQPNKGMYHPHISTYVLPFDRLYPDKENHAWWRWWVAVSRMINACRGLATAQREIGCATEKFQELGL
jgi:hypothetical protein